MNSRLNSWLVSAVLVMGSLTGCSSDDHGLTGDELQENQEACRDIAKAVDQDVRDGNGARKYQTSLELAGLKASYPPLVDALAKARRAHLKNKDVQNWYKTLAKPACDKLDSQW